MEAGKAAAREAAAVVEARQVGAREAAAREAGAALVAPGRGRCQGWRRGTRCSSHRPPARPALG